MSGHGAAQVCSQSRWKPSSIGPVFALPRCLKLLDELILLRDVAMHQRREPPDRRVSNTENAEIHEERVTNFYMSHRDLAADTPMPYGGTLAMTRLLEVPIGRSRELNNRRLIMNTLSIRASPAFRYMSALRLSSISSLAVSQVMALCGSFIVGNGCSIHSSCHLPIGCLSSMRSLHHPSGDFLVVIADIFWQGQSKSPPFLFGFQQDFLSLVNRLVLGIVDNKCIRETSVHLLPE